MQTNFSLDNSIIEKLNSLVNQQATNNEFIKESKKTYEAEYYIKNKGVTIRNKDIAQKYIDSFIKKCNIAMLGNYVVEEKKENISVFVLPRVCVYESCFCKCFFCYSFPPLNIVIINKDWLPRLHHLVHEMAHIIEFQKNGFKGKGSFHGKEFRNILIDVTNKYRGKRHKKELEYCFNRFG